MRLIIIGGGHAAAHLAGCLHRQNFQGSIALVCDETIPPYQRPPLSKAFLSGDITTERLSIHAVNFYKRAGIDLYLNNKAAAIDRQNGQVVLKCGQKLPYDRLVIATGGRARTLGDSLTAAATIRSVTDASDLRTKFSSTKEVTVIGGGYLGLEVAAAGRKAGKPVTLVESQPRLLSRSATPEAANFILHKMLEHQVDVQLSINTNSWFDHRPKQSRPQQIRARTVPDTDSTLLVAAIGMIPNMEIAENCGIKTEKSGIVVNEFCQTNDPAIYAIGDVTWHYNARYDRWHRLESVQNATDQAKAAASHIMGTPIPYDSLPWFWSELFNGRLQIAGLALDFDRVITRGSPHDNSIAFFAMRDNHIQAAECFNRVKEFMLSKQLILNKVEVDADILADDSKDFSGLAKSWLGQ